MIIKKESYISDEDVERFVKACRDYTNKTNTQIIQLFVSFVEMKVCGFIRSYNRIDDIGKSCVVDSQLYNGIWCAHFFLD